MNKTTDFQKIIKEIYDSGLNDQAISDKTNIVRSAISKVRLGHQTRVLYDDGVALIKLHGEVVK